MGYERTEAGLKVSLENPTLNEASLAIEVLAWVSSTSLSQIKEKKGSSGARVASPFFMRSQESLWGLPSKDKESKVVPLPLSLLILTFSPIKSLKRIFDQNEIVV